MSINEHQTSALPGSVAAAGVLGGKQTLFGQLSRLVPEGAPALAFQFEEYVLVEDAANDEPPLPASRA